MMKSKYKYIAVLLFICCMLSACQIQPESAVNPASPSVLRIAGGAPSGGYYLQSTPIASLWDEIPQVDITKVEASIGAFENLYLMDMGEADAGLADLYAAHCAMNGLEPYRHTLAGFKIMAYSTPVTLHLIVRASSDIYTVSDLKGHSLATGTPGSATEAEVRSVLELAGVAYNDLIRVDCVGVGASMTELQDGKVDAVAAMLMYPDSSVVETMLNTDIRLLSFSEDEIAMLEEQAPWLEQSTIPGGIYEGLQEPTQSVSVPCAMWVREGLSDELVYSMTKTLYENIGQLSLTNASFKKWELTPDELEEPMLHEGARKFYMEVSMG